MACDLLLSDCGTYGRPISHLTMRPLAADHTVAVSHDALIVIAAEQASAAWSGCRGGIAQPLVTRANCRIRSI